MRTYRIAIAAALMVTAVRVILPLALAALVAYLAIRALVGC
jgi:hypothetical protein